MQAREIPRTLAVLAIALAATAVACSGHRAAHGNGSGAGDRFGVYRGRFIEPGQSPRKLKVLLFAASPDRLHAEVLPPLGGPALIIDGGGGRLAVTVGSRDAAWVGEAREEILESILGFPVTLEGLVGAFLQGSTLAGPVEVSRSPRSGPGLPRRFELGLEGRELQLELQGTRKRGRGGYAIGTGTPPPGVEVRPLEELTSEEDPILFRED
jgi:hypothetical protein